MTSLCLFDVDGTLTYPRKVIEGNIVEMLQRLQARPDTDVGLVGGSNIAKIKSQLGNIVESFDFVFAENGLDAYFQGSRLENERFIDKIGEESYKTLVNYILHYIADLDIPKKRGTFVEFRIGMINISPIGRNTTPEEREEYEAFEQENQIHKRFIEDLRRAFPDFELEYSCGSCSSIDIYPIGWDKSFCLRHIRQLKRKYSYIYFFGDKTYEGGNDYGISTQKDVIPFTVASPSQTLAIVNQLFFQGEQPELGATG